MGLDLPELGLEHLLPLSLSMPLFRQDSLQFLRCTEFRCLFGGTSNFAGSASFQAGLEGDVEVRGLEAGTAGYLSPENE